MWSEYVIRLLAVVLNPWYHKTLVFFQNNMCMTHNSPHCITINSHWRGGGERFWPQHRPFHQRRRLLLGFPHFYGPLHWVSPPHLPPPQPLQGILASTFIIWESRQPLLSCWHANVNKTVLFSQHFKGKLNHCRGVVINCRTSVWLRGSSSASLWAPELIVSVDRRPRCCVSKPQHRQSCFIPRPDARHPLSLQENTAVLNCEGHFPRIEKWIPQLF